MNRKIMNAVMAGLDPAIHVLERTTGGRQVVDPRVKPGDDAVWGGARRPRRPVNGQFARHPGRPQGRSGIALSLFHGDTGAAAGAASWPGL